MFSIPSLILILVIVILLFGTKRLKNIGSDLGGALKGFKSAIKDEDAKAKQNIKQDDQGSVIEGEVIKENEKTK